MKYNPMQAEGEIAVCIGLWHDQDGVKAIE
jgi:hypothetical protein